MHKELKIENEGETTSKSLKIEIEAQVWAKKLGAEKMIVVDLKREKECGV